MNTQHIIEALEAERDRLNVAIAALSGSQTRRKAARKGRKRKMSAEARERMSRAQKKRWAARKKK